MQACRHPEFGDCAPGLEITIYDLTSELLLGFQNRTKHAASAKAGVPLGALGQGIGSRLYSWRPLRWRSSRAVDHLVA